MGSACWEGDLGEWGNPRTGGVELQRSRFGGRPDWDSERVIVPLKPGNAGGGKGPHFRNAFEEAKVR